MSRNEVVELLDGYARSIDAPVRTGVSVTGVERQGDGFRVTTDQGTWIAGNVVIATGQNDTPHVPDMARYLSPAVTQLVPTRYRNPGQLPEGGVLVVGAAATGLQLAFEIQESGRPVTLAVGTHTRLPRTYRGRDIMWWLDALGLLDEPATRKSNLDAARKEPSLHLIGCPDHREIDLGTAQDAGVRLVGRALDARGTTLRFADDLSETMGTAQGKLERLLRRIEDHIDASGMEGKLPAPGAIPPIPVPAAPTRIDLEAAGIRTVLWATGYRRRYPWLQVPVLDRRGEIEHDGGVTRVPGLYVLGLNFLRRRNSTFIDGVGNDARDLAEHIATRVESPSHARYQHAVA
jgi:putative flavoprotein involved in K+ transport